MSISKPFAYVRHPLRRDPPPTWLRALHVYRDAPWHAPQHASRQDQPREEEASPPIQRQSLPSDE